MAVKRQLSMVLDLNKCIGCHTCSTACKLMWTNRNGRNSCIGTTWRASRVGYPVIRTDGRWLRCRRRPAPGPPAQSGRLRHSLEYNYQEALMTGTDPAAAPRQTHLGPQLG